MIHKKSALMVITTSAFIFALGAPALAEEAAPQHIQDWVEFAKKSGRPEDQKWAELLNHPDTVALYKGWKEWRGYDVTQLLKRDQEAGKIPPELKPGLEITQANYQSFPWLKDFLPQSVIERLASKDWLPVKKLRVVPSTSYYLSKGWLGGVKKETGQFYVDADGAARVKNCVTCGGGGEDTWALRSQGLPFGPNPKDGWDLIWLHMAMDVGADNLYFKPIDFVSCSSKNTVERTQSGHVWWMRFHGRVDWEPIPEFPGREEVFQGGSIFWLHPFDIKGLCGVRLRHFDPKKDDSFVVFLPFLKRTRVLAGSDTQDPLCANCDITWDEWRAFWQHISKKDQEYTIVGEGWILGQPEMGMVSLIGSDFQDCGWESLDVELRPVWILEMKDKTGRYQYSKRLLWIDKEYYYVQHQEMYDKRGNLWRAWWLDRRYWNPRTGIGAWGTAGTFDQVNKHSTHWWMHTDFEEARTSTKLDYFDIESLRTYK